MFRCANTLKNTVGLLAYLLIYFSYSLSTVRIPKSTSNVENAVFSNFMHACNDFPF